MCFPTRLTFFGGLTCFHSIIFHSPQSVSGLLSRYLHDVEKAFRSALDPRALAQQQAQHAAAGAAAGSRTGVAPGTQDKLWSGLREACDTLAAALGGAWHLQRVAAKKRDPLSHVLLLDALCPPGTPLVTERLWGDILKAVGDAFSAAAKPSAVRAGGSGAYVREALANAYPRLAGLLESTVERLATDTTMKVRVSLCVPAIKGGIALCAIVRCHLSVAVGSDGLPHDGIAYDYMNAFGSGNMGPDDDNVHPS